MPTETASGNDSLVSVICRTIGRAELTQTIDSVVAQTHRPIELIVVDASNSGMDSLPTDSKDIAVNIINTGSQLPRAEAGNAGLAAATGEYFLFLDDDDWIAPEHVGGLLETLQADSSIKGAYSNTQKTDRNGKNPSYVFEQDYDPNMLLRDNFIPIHSILFHRSLYDEGCRFDPEFEIFEDWDFWIQASQLTSFKHITAATAFYREGGDSETSTDDIAVRYDNESVMGKARVKVFNKWVKKWRGEQVNSMLASLDQGALAPRLAEQLKAEHESNLQLQDQIRGQLVELEKLQDALNIEKGRSSDLQNTLQHRDEKIATIENGWIELQERNGKLAADLEFHSSMLDEIRHSLSWKLMRPFRVLRRMLSGKSASENQDSDTS